MTVMETIIIMMLSYFDDNDEIPVQDNDEEFFPEAEMDCFNFNVMYTS